MSGATPPSRPFSTPWTSCPGRTGGTSWYSCPASGRSARRPRACASTACRSPRCCPCMPASARRSRGASSGRPASGASCWPPMWRKPPSRCRASAMSSTRALPASAATATAARFSACPWSAFPRPPPISARAAAGGWRKASASACTRRRISPAVPSSPSRRFCAPIWRR